MPEEVSQSPSEPVEASIKQKKSPVLTVFLVLLIVLLICAVVSLVGYIVYDKFIAEEKGGTSDKIEDQENEEEDTEEVVQRGADEDEEVSEPVEEAPQTKSITFQIDTDPNVQYDLKITAEVPFDTSITPVGTSPFLGKKLSNALYSLTIVIPYEAYGEQLPPMVFAFSDPGMGQVYRSASWDGDPTRHVYVSDPTMSGTCDVLGDILPAPCGATVVGGSDYIFMAECVGGPTALTICDNILKSFSVIRIGG